MNDEKEGKPNELYGLNSAVPKCGESDKRNTAYESNYSPENFFSSITNVTDPVILDVGAHKGESIKFLSLYLIPRRFFLLSRFMQILMN